MTECETVARRWGNSLGVTLPKEVVEKENIKENEKVTLIVVNKSKNLSQLFGTLKGRWKKSAQQLKDEIRAELYND